MFHVLAARGARAFGDGLVSVVFPLYLLRIGMSPLDVGVLSTLTLLGSALLSLAAGFFARYIGYRVAVLAGAALMVATGVGLAGVTRFWPLAVVALAGTLNPSSGDASVFMPLEHAVLSARFPGPSRTAAFARYSFVGAVAGALGAMAASLPELVAAATAMPVAAAYRLAFVAYAALGLACAALYAVMPRTATPERVQRGEPAVGVSRRHVLLLAALFAVDAFAGGFIVQSLLGLWLVQRFAADARALGALFFATGVLSALSYLAAVPVARRFGLVRTMVFTHLPSSVLLLATAFVPTWPLAVLLLLARSLLSQIDVPTRSAYVMALVTPAERPAAASVTGVTRALAGAGGPLLAGYLLAGSSFGWPLVVAGGLKIAYDLALFACFGAVEAREEVTQGPAPAAPRRAQTR